MNGNEKFILFAAGFLLGIKEVMESKIIEEAVKQDILGDLKVLADRVRHLNLIAEKKLV